MNGDYIMEKLVSLYQGKEARVSTFNIFAGFGYKEHRSFKMVIFKNREKFEARGKLFAATVVAANKKKKGGQEQGYLLNERQFRLLVLLAKNTPESIDLKEKIDNEFERMKNALAQATANRSNQDWVNSRKDGKQIYLQKTDVIKSFVDYATEQGSESAKLYYRNIAKMENAALFILEQKYPNVREFLNIRQLFQIATADQIVEKALQDGMTQKLHYKDIYQLAKDRVIQFSNIIGKSLVIEFQQKKLINEQDTLNQNPPEVA